jgi:hypothetical protein
MAHEISIQASEDFERDLGGGKASDVGDRHPWCVTAMCRMNEVVTDFVEHNFGHSFQS